MNEYCDERMGDRLTGKSVRTCDYRCVTWLTASARRSRLIIELSLIHI